ncbi:NADP-dependent oxidoreductase [Actinokineospora sp. PR83]|uniref:MDR family NADP-dependent oxidoreductase n=1 Tax=Actinokineospora sp. PR83 TaxID=2884908 RepID=UPI0027DEBB06|nr:zinc-binding dehydrogenase [Actinokineospora sp. PR83]MCG8920466.1 NADP-dependent oxidoreductase [Actinokineospora sp. PR83]
MKVSQWVVREHMRGVPDPARIYEKVEEELVVDLAEDEMLLETLYVSVDPYQQGLALDTRIGDHMGADSVMRVLEAGPRALFRPGDLVQGFGGWRTHVVDTGGPTRWDSTWHAENMPLVFPAYRLLDPAHYGDALPLHTALSVLGGPGMTAWGAMRKVLQVRPGDSVLISGASGAIGSVAGQLARLAGAGRVVATTRSAAKTEHLLGLGFDEVVVYNRDEPREEVRDRLRRALPKGVDRYLDTVGGALTDEVFGMLAIGARIAICAQFESQVGGDHVGPRLLPLLMRPQATVRGVFSLEWMEDPACWVDLEADLGNLVRTGAVVHEHTMHEGFDSIPAAYGSLFADGADKRGKVLVRL